MNKLKMIVIVISSLFVVYLADIHAQTSTANIEEVYQKPDNKIWGDIYAWAFNRREFRKSYALVIGIGDYKQWPQLESPYYDAIRVRDFLINDEGFDLVVTLTNDKATKDKINMLMDETFPKLVKADDRFLFYYSGHGTQRMIAGAPLGYLPLKNSGLESYANMISMDEIARWDNILRPARHVLFVLDCCFSGLAGQQHKSLMEDKKLERLSQYAHHLITAGTANEVSIASLPKWQGSLFTDSFLKAVSGRADLSSPDYGADGVVSLKELTKYIGDRIDDESAKLKSKRVKLSPQISDLQDNEGEFFFITRYFKNQKLGNARDHALNYGWPTVETKGRPIFRSEPASFSYDQMKSMLKNKGFFDSYDNKTGRGFDNQFILQERSGEKVAIDQASGLMWQQSGSSNSMTFDQAKQWINDLNAKRYAGYNDWRLPTLEEAMSLMEPEKRNGNLYIDPVFDNNQTWIWTSDLGQGASWAWVVNFSSGRCDDDRFYDNYVRAVRFGQSSPE